MLVNLSLNGMIADHGFTKGSYLSVKFLIIWVDREICTGNPIQPGRIIWYICKNGDLIGISLFLSSL
jgi:hypothetical protein